MSNKVIDIINLGKQYRLGQVGSTTMADDLKRWWYNALGKEDPFLKIGEENDRTKKGGSEYVWALKDINFSVNQGEVLGIIGKNGAGKSTLLKILSRTTSPTIGEYRIKGRVASLLEVGTGFHPDLSGRENLFLNGAILGMKKSEIKSKFEEIVDFSGVERYIDTPVKRYSSGMYVRLAFAVAAHLNPDVLIIDEVLAVGDIEFQEKCLGKMKDVAGQGRTVLFVSHNMSAIKSLCTRGILIENGLLKIQGNIDTVVSQYLSNSTLKSVWDINSANIKQGNRYKVTSICVKDQLDNIVSNINISESFFVEINFEVIEDLTAVGFSLVFSNNESICLFGSLNNHEPNFYNKKLSKGNYTARCELNGNIFNDIELVISLITFGSQWTDSYVIENAIKINAIDDGVLKGDFYGEYGGLFRPKLNWKTEKK